MNISSRLKENTASSDCLLSNDLIPQAIQQAMAGIAITDLQGNVLYVNAAAAKITGYRAEEMYGVKLQRLIYGFMDRAVYRGLRRALEAEGHWQGEFWGQRRDGESYRQILNINCLHDDQGRRKYFLHIFHELGAQEENEGSVCLPCPGFDALTGLVDRQHFQDILTRHLQQAVEFKQSVALLMMDVDRFKPINESLSHAFGDELLRILAARIQACTPDRAVAARMGGDEFAILVPIPESRVDCLRELNALARRLLRHAAQPIVLGPEELSITMSIGIAMFPQDADDAGRLLQDADSAMYHAKAHGRNSYQFYAEDMNADSRGRLVLESSLRRALERREFELYYQPQIDIENERIIGVEALIRWHHRDLGVVSPLRFIPLAEETGMIIPIGDWVLNQACRQIRDWRDRGWNIRMAVNLSPLQFRQQDLAAKVAAALEFSDLDSSVLELEITETSLMDDMSRTFETLNALQRMGVRLSVDDFGTGYSSLAYLQRFPIHALKIDRGFIEKITAVQGDASIVKAIINLAHSLNLSVIAEGVETREQLEFLAGERCNEVQGFLFGRPMPAEDLSALIESKKLKLA